jgi:hypothetical protein
MLLGLLAHGRDGSITPRQAQTGHMRATSAAAAASWAKSWLSWVQQQIWQGATVFLKCTLKDTTGLETTGRRVKLAEKAFAPTTLLDTTCLWRCETHCSHSNRTRLQPDCFACPFCRFRQCRILNVFESVSTPVRVLYQIQKNHTAVKLKDV